MRLAKNILLFIFCSFLLTCKKENMCDCLKRTGDIVRQERTVPHLRYFNFGKGKMNYFITNDSAFKIEVEAGENLIDLVRTEAKGDTLFFTDNNKCNFSRSYKPQINIYISTPDLLYIEHNGVGAIQSTNTITGYEIILETWSSGDILMDINCSSLYTHTHNSTAMYLTGSAWSHYSSMWHNSTFYGENLKTAYTRVYDNTTGNFYCQVDSQLTATMLLSGDVIYSGKPNITVDNLGGTGKVSSR